jgi:hypothetical protein
MRLSGVRFVACDFACLSYEDPLGAFPKLSERIELVKWGKVWLRCLEYQHLRQQRSREPTQSE